MRAYLLVGAIALTTAACDAFPRGGERDAEPNLVLNLNVANILDWGSVSEVQLTLSNQGSATGRSAHVELYVPSWLEFSSVDPEGTEVSVLRSGGETRLVYRLGVPALQPGESRTVVQRVRVPPRTAAVSSVPAQTDSATGARAETAMAAVPRDRTLRARLVSPEGDALGSEMSTTMQFAGADNLTAPMPTQGAPAAGADPRVTREGVGPVRLGQTVPELRQAVTGTRDTTFTLGEGAQERGVVVPLAGGRSVVALIVDDRVDRVIVRDRGVQTERGLGVGSTFQQLSQAYGRPCLAPGAGGGTAVWFPSLPGISFAFDVTAPVSQDTAAAGVPATAQVRELWVRRGVDSC
ncbi:MAG TPA: hypothetical protein VK912_03025 [Longimicrobiales bacterium]|nr:hypothetical protein [Longimicrobiales bacterium]